MKPAIIFGAIGLGFVLLVLSSVWSTLFPARATWSEDKATRWRDVKSEIYNLGFVINRKNSMHGGQDRGAAMAKYHELKMENEQLTSDFESAANRPNIIARALKWSGIVLAAVGIVGWFAVRDSS